MTFGALLAVPAITSAAAVSTSGTVITFTAAAGETNNLVVTQPASNSYLFNDAVAVTESSANRTATGGNLTGSGVSWTSVVVNLNDNNDVFTATGVNDDPFTINGGDDDDGNITGSGANDVINGNDTSDNATATGLSGGPGDDIIDGGAGATGDIINGNDGNDWLYGGTEGADDLNGGAGNDRMDGGQGAASDDYDGGADLDRVVYGSLDPPGTPNFTYACTAQPVFVSLNNTAADGCASAIKDSENVQSTVESVTGSTLGDTITGSCLPNTFAGSAGTASGHTDGDDTLNGDPAACAPNGGDFLGGGEGNDTFNCDGTGATPGVDTVTYGTPYTGGAAISVTLDTLRTTLTAWAAPPTTSSVTASGSSAPPTATRSTPRPPIRASSCSAVWAATR